MAAKTSKPETEGQPIDVTKSEPMSPEDQAAFVEASSKDPAKAKQMILDRVRKNNPSMTDDEVEASYGAVEAIFG